VEHASRCRQALTLIALPVVQMQRGMWMMTPPHGGYMHQAYGPLHGRYLHGLMADGTSCERFVPDSCYFVPGPSAGHPAQACAQVSLLGTSLLTAELCSARAAAREDTSLAACFVQVTSSRGSRRSRRHL
jgi:hypothetical protein